MHKTVSSKVGFIFSLSALLSLPCTWNSISSSLTWLVACDQLDSWFWLVKHSTFELNPQEVFWLHQPPMKNWWPHHDYWIMASRIKRHMEPRTDELKWAQEDNIWNAQVIDISYIQRFHQPWITTIQENVYICNEHTFFHRQYRMITIYIVLHITNNLEMICNIQEVDEKLYANIIPFYIRNLNIWGFS
jgi:hypothetical protein